MPEIHYLKEFNRELKSVLNFYSLQEGAIESVIGAVENILIDNKAEVEEYLNNVL